MIAVDTSAWIDYLSRDRDSETSRQVDDALTDKLAVLPPVVLSELVSDPKLPESLRDYFVQFPLLETTDGYWERTGMLRAEVLKRGRKARLADALIAQTCIDHDIGLITCDADFRSFAKYGNLKLL